MLLLFSIIFFGRNQDIAEAGRRRVVATSFMFSSYLLSIDIDTLVVVVVERGVYVIVPISTLTRISWFPHHTATLTSSHHHRKRIADVIMIPIPHYTPAVIDLPLKAVLRCSTVSS